MTKLKRENPEMRQKYRAGDVGKNAGKKWKEKVLNQESNLHNIDMVTINKHLA